MHNSYQKWLNENKPKIYCQCGCNEEIIIEKHHKYYGIPKYVRGHQNKGENNIAKKPNIRKKLSEAKKGENNHFFGKHHTEKTKKKISENHKGMKGKHHIENAKQKISKANKNPSEKTRKKMSNAKKGRIPSPKTGYGKRFYYNFPLQGEICFRSSYELKFAEYLDKNNISWLYEIQTFDLGNTTYTPDFYLPTSDLFIEVKGYIINKAQEKINKFLDNYNEETLKILRKEDLVKLGIKL